VVNALDYLRAQAKRWSIQKIRVALEGSRGLIGVGKLQLSLEINP
jgi:hypothetical protein